jgi:UDP-GlcNAc:undecaprenyl-phosphate GlcNAc-1-phosphate transferase
VVLVVLVCNATNLLDGLDGLCSGVTAIISVGFLMLAAWLATWGRFPGTDELRIGLCLSMAGAILGFMPYNIPPASIFMGDAGSMLLGFFVATMMALFCQEGPFRWFLAACVVFALPILDTALAVVRRFRSGMSIFAGDRSHLYDQLVDRGMTIKQVVILFYILAGSTATMGVILAVNLRTRYALILYGILAVVIWSLFSLLGMVSPTPKCSSAKASQKTGHEQREENTNDTNQGKRKTES